MRDLIRALLQFDPRKRLSVSQLFEMEIFQDIRDLQLENAGQDWKIDLPVDSFASNLDTEDIPRQLKELEEFRVMILKEANKVL